MAEQPIEAMSAWQLILASVNRDQVVLPLPGSSRPVLSLGKGSNWSLLAPATPEARALFDLFLPLCRPFPEGRVHQTIGQLGQSLDGRIATVTGASKYINGGDGITHLHRLRAVSDAVVVGAGTACEDNPRLTVRRAEGRNPVRVVVDPNCRVPDSYHLFTDGQAPTLRLTAGTLPEDFDYKLPETGTLEVPCLGQGGTQTDPATIIDMLGRFGLKRLFIEGGGLTVSGFMKAGLLDRLHVMVAPMIIGSGRAAFSLPEIESLTHAMRPQAQVVNLGSDTLFDLDLRCCPGHATGF